MAEKENKPVSTAVSTKPPGGLWKHPETGRYYWRFKLPGRKRQQVALVPKGAQKATKAKGVAEACRKRLWKEMCKGEVDVPKVAHHWLDRFLSWCKHRAGSKQAKYNHYVASSFIEHQKIHHMHDIDMEHVQSYLDSLTKVGARTIEAHRNSLHLFFRYLIAQRELEINPADAVEVKPPAKKAPEFLTDHQLDVSLRWIERRAPRWVYHACGVAAFVGARRGSLDALEKVHVGQGGITVPLCKQGGRFVVVSYDDPFIDPRLKEFAFLALENAPAGKYVFPRHHERWWGQQLGRATNLLPVFGEQSGKLWHLFRSTWAVNCARRGANLWQLMALGGWTTPTVVMRYVNIARAAGMVKETR